MAVSVPIKPTPVYDSAQLPMLMRLLAEYTAKLRQQCEKYEKGAESINSDLIQIVILVFLFIAVVTYQVWLDLHPAEANRPHNSVSIVPAVLTFIEIGFIAALAGAVLKAVNAIIRFKRTMRSHVSVAAAQLERLVRRISPIAEYANIGLGEKLELDLRLADADAALEYAAQYAGKRDKSENGLARAKVLEASLR